MKRRILSIVFMVLVCILGISIFGKDNTLRVASEDNKDFGNSGDIEYLSKKSFEEYTLEDCLLILNSPMYDICEGYGIDISLEPSSGLLLPGSTLASPVVYITQGIFLTCQFQQDKIENDTRPSKIYLYGGTGEQTILDEFQFGMQLEENSFDMINNTVFKVSEVGGTYPARQIEIEKEGAMIVLTFEFVEDEYLLNSVAVGLVDIGDGN